MKKPSTYLTQRFFDAVQYAAEMHKEQVRKSTEITYICHPLGVASLVLEAGGDEDLAIAALLHDVAEDCGGEVRLDEINERFGKRVADIVRGCSDSLVADPEEKAKWFDRKQVHIEHLNNASPDTLLVTAADKTHNARSIATDLRNQGASLWERFNASRVDIIWYYDSIYEVLAKRDVTNRLLTPLREAIDAIKRS
ncbi:MAG: hypothetical protein RL410_1124 [Actinomycetota bacterium]